MMEIHEVNEPAKHTFGEYTFERNESGSYQRVIDDDIYEELLHYYRHRVYVAGEFRDGSLLEASQTELDRLAQREQKRAERRLARLSYFSVTGGGDSSLLELGCGSGALLAEWNRRSLGLAEGIDISELSLPVSARMWSEDLTIRVGEVISVLTEMTSHEGYRFDLVSAFDLIEHIWKPEELIELMRFVLKPRGQCVIEVPVISPAWSWDEVITFRLFHPQNHLHLFTPSGIYSLFNKSGFDTIHASFSDDNSSYLMVFEK